MDTLAKQPMRKLAELAYGEAPYKDIEIAHKHVLDVISKNEADFVPFLSRWPTFPTMLYNALCGRVGYRVQQTSVTNSSALELTEEDARLIGCAIITLARKRKTGAVAIDAWRVQYKPLQASCEQYVVVKHSNSSSRANDTHTHTHTHKQQPPTDSLR